jgi:crotonobetainyl-CoA:carnitine CoA-transferase CaiB-like acyl-CoA transferase
MAGRPLDGIRVLDMTAYIAGPFACSLLADLGAEVIKVEPPEGDMMRYYPSSLAEESRVFLGVNRGKRSIVIDMKAPGGREAFFSLADTADVVVENMRPGVMKRLGIDYDTLKARNDKLIHLSLTGYGEGGPMRDSAGYDQALQAMTGISVAQGVARGTQPVMIQGSIVDFYASTMAVIGILAGLFERTKSQAGQHVGLSLLQASLAMQAGRLVEADGEPREIDRDLHNGKVAGIHPTKDGYIYFQASTPRFWTNLCTLLGIPELAADPRYDTIRKRGALADELLPRLHEALAAKSAVEWHAVLDGQVPCALVQSVNDMLDHPQVLAEGLIERMEHEALGGYRGLARPISFGRTPLGPSTGAPGLGQHTDAVLAAAGYSADAIAQLRANGAIQ